MGSAQSTVVQQTIEVFNKNVSNTVLRTINTASSTCIASNNFTIEIGENGIYQCDNLNINQTASTNCDMSVQFNAGSSTDLQTTVQNAIEETAKSDQKSVQDFMALSISVQSDVKTMKQHITNIVEKNFDSTVQNNILNSAKADNTGKFIVNGKVYCKNAAWTQNAQAALLTDAVTDSIVNMLSKDTVVNQAVIDAEIKQASEQQGLGGVIQSFFQAYTVIIIVIAIVLIVLIGGAVYFLMSPAGQKIASEVKIPGSPMTPSLSTPMSPALNRSPNITSSISK